MRNRTALAATASLLAFLFSAAMVPTTSLCHIEYYDGPNLTIQECVCVGACTTTPDACDFHYENLPSGGKRWSCRCGGQGGIIEDLCRGEMQFDSDGFYERVACDSSIVCGGGKECVEKEPGFVGVPGQLVNPCECDFPL